MPKYLADRISISGHEYRVIADTQEDVTEVWGKDLAWEFKNRAAAYSYLAEAYKTAQDLRNIAPGQEIQLTMADGTLKRVNVLSNDAMQIAFTDATGKQYTFPHMQPGVEPRIMPKKDPNSQSPGDNAEGGENTTLGPGTGTTMARRSYYENHPCNECGEKRCESCGVCHNCQDKKALSKKHAESFPHRHPQNCKHDGQYLQRKDPSDPEKACPQCGMVYEAAVTVEEVSSRDPLIERVAPVWNCPRCPRRNPAAWPSCPCGARKPAPKQALSKRQAGCDSDFFVEGDHCDCPAHKGKKKALSKKAFHFSVGDTVRFKHPQLGETAGKIVRDDGSQYVIRQGEEMLAVPAQYVLGPVYNANRRVAQPQMPSGPPGQSVPPSSPPMSTQQTGPQQAPAGDQAQPVDQPGQNRALSRHEIITEAEILIRNALHKGIRIGTWDLVEYMQQNYSNPPEELYEGATKAWEKVQWEEQEAFETSKGPGPSQQKHPGDEAQEAPTSVEDVANQPRTGPTQVKV